MAIETEAERLSSTYVALEDTLDTDNLVQLREPVLESEESSVRRRRRKVYDVLVPSSKHSTPHYVKEDAKEDLIA